LTNRQTFSNSLKLPKLFMALLSESRTGLRIVPDTEQILDEFVE
jgi:hypothetical protein